MSRIACALAAVTALLFLACPAWAEEGRLSVAVSILPQKYIAERIGGENVSVQALVPAGMEPHAFEPKPAQMTELARTPLYLAVGAPFEAAWLPRFSGVNKALRIVRVDEGIDKLPLAEHGHEHGGHGAHGDGGLDPHVWTAPSSVAIMARNTAAALAAADPGHAAAYQEGLLSFLAEVKATDAAVREALKDVPKGTSFMVFHPAFAYFARDYGLKEVAIEQSGKEPGPRELARLTDEAREEKVAVIFVEPQFSSRAAQTVARQVGARVETIDPLALDWSANLLRVARAFAASGR